MSMLGFVLDDQQWVFSVDTQPDFFISPRSTYFEPLGGVRFLSTLYPPVITPDTKIISQIKRLIGRPFADPELQQEIRSLPFLVTEGPDGFPVIHARSHEQCETLTPTQVLGHFFSRKKKLLEETLNTVFVDCCIGIPIYFTNLQRRAVLDAAAIAGLNPLRLMHETTAAALTYGQHATLPHNVAFVDIGAASMQVCIAHVRRGKVMVLAHSFDRCLGGRDFDEVLFQHFAGKFEVDYKIDVLQNQQACFGLRAECEKLKKILTQHREAQLNIKCFMDVDGVSGVISRDEFEQLSAPILKRVEKTLENALAEAQLRVDDIEAVLVVGSGYRVPAVEKILTKFFGKVPRPAMDKVAMGCALEGDMLSKPTSKIREVHVRDRFPFSIALKWKGMAQDSQNGTVEDHQSIVFPKGNPIPSVKALTFAGSGTFSLEYTDVSELKAPIISTWTIRPFQATHAEGAMFKVKARLNRHGIVSLDAAELIEEEVEVPVTKERWREATKDRVIDEAKNNALVAYVRDMWFKLYDKPFEFVKDSEREQFIAKLHETEDWLYEDGEDETIGVYEAKLDELKKQGDPIEQHYRHHVIEEINAIRRDMLAYVDGMRDKLRVHGELYEFVTDSDRYKLVAKLEKTKDWLHKDELNQLMETKGGYVAKFDELKKLGDPIEHRFNEHSETRLSVVQLASDIQKFKNAVADSKYDHHRNCRAKVLKKCNDVESWVRLANICHKEQRKHIELKVLSADISKKKEELIRVCNQILSTVDVHVNMEDAPENGALDTGDNAVKTEVDAKTIDSSSQRPPVLREKIRSLINESLTQNFSKLPDVYGQFIPVEGVALEKHGDDYQCSNVIRHL